MTVILPARWLQRVKLQHLRVFLQPFLLSQLSQRIALPCFYSNKELNRFPIQNKEQQASSSEYNTWPKSALKVNVASKSSPREENCRKKLGKCKYLFKSQICACNTLDCTENGEISLVTNKMRSPTPNCTDEWAFHAMTSLKVVVAQSEQTLSKRAQLKS